MTFFSTIHSLVDDAIQDFQQEHDTKIPFTTQQTIHSIMWGSAVQELISNTVNSILSKETKNEIPHH